MPKKRKRIQKKIIEEVIDQEEKPEEEEMATNAIMPGKFRGGMEENVEEWIAIFDRIATANNWNEEKKVGILGCFLEGEAYSWYATQLILPVPPVLWNEWREGLIRTFRHCEELKYTRLESRRMESNDTPESYYFDMVRLCHQCDPNMTNVAKIYHLERGLPTGLKRDFVLTRPGTPEEFLVILQRIWINQRMTMKEEDKEEKKISELTKVVFELRNQVSRLSQPREYNVGNQYYGERQPPFKDQKWENRPPRINYGWTPQGQPICYQCKKEGHIASRCPGRMNQGNEETPAAANRR
jgi:hypothetical protein